MRDTEIRVEVDDSDEATNVLNTTTLKLNKLLALKEIFWKQRWKVKWLKDCDKNTKFFHATVNQKKCKMRAYP